MNIKDKVPAEVIKVWDVLEAEGLTYLVGGALRDLYLDKIPHDWDLSTKLTPTEVERIGKEHGWRVIPTGVSFGTVTILSPIGGIEVTTFRKEGRYKDGRHPQDVKFAETIEEDLSRRDFTINAMALSWDGELIDPYEGYQDIINRQIITVGDAVDRFTEDPLRMLRGIRFTGLDAHGDPFVLGIGVAMEITRLKPLILNVSGERQRDELMKILSQPHFEFALQMLVSTGLLGIIWPEWVAAYNFDQQNKHHNVYKYVHEHLLMTSIAGKTPLMRLVGLLHDIGKPSCFVVDDKGQGHFYEHDHVGAIYARRMLERLAFDRDTIDHVTMLIDQHMFPWDEAGHKSIRRMVREHGLERVHELLELRRMDVAGSGREWENQKKVWNKVQKAVENVPDKAEWKLEISGKDVMEVKGIGSGPEVGRYLRILTDWVDEHPEFNTYEALMSQLKNIS